jgi:hypothetical protein
MTSIGIMIKRIKGLHGTSDLTDWENRFVGSVWEKTDAGINTVSLSEKQIEIIERIHNKHFA